MTTLSPEEERQIRTEAEVSARVVVDTFTNFHSRLKEVERRLSKLEEQEKEQPKKKKEEVGEA